jgi:cytochrome b ascorbate-dependent protein 3
VAFRLLSFGKFANKLIHGCFHSLAIACFSLGLAAVVAANDQTNKGEGGYTANLWSLHSFIGIAALILYVQNYLLGFSTFMLPYASVQIRYFYAKYHRQFGRMFLIASTAAICTGIMDIMLDLSCEPEVSHRDVNTGKVYFDSVPLGCRMVNGAGILVLIASLCALYSVSNVEAQPILKQGI